MNTGLLWCDPRSSRVVAHNKIRFHPCEIFSDSGKTKQEGAYVKIGVSTSGGEYTKSLGL